MNTFDELMSIVIKSTIYGMCLALDLYGLFYLFRKLFHKCKQLAAFLKKSLDARNN